MLELEMPTLNEVLKEAGGNELLLEELLSKFRLWLKQQLHLPQDVSDERLKFYICAAKFDFEKAKKRIEMFHILRNFVPEVWSNLDPLGHSLIQFHKCVQWIVVPKLTPEKCRLNITRMIDTDSSMYEPWLSLRYCLMISELRIKEDVVNTDIVILDCIGVNMGHILKFSPLFVKKSEVCLEASGLRLKGIYIINAPKIVDIVMTMIKSIVKAKIFERIHIYTSGIESLDGIIPKSILPIDYGGEQPSMSTLTDMWRAKMAEQRDWFLNEEKIILANQSIRSNSIINPDDFFGVSGTFRKLEVD